METLTNSSPDDGAQRSAAAVDVVIDPGSLARRAPIQKRPGRAPDPRKTHKRKGRVDRRVQAYRIRAAREAQIAAHLGGVEAMSVVQESLARRWVTLDLRAAQMESDAAAGRPFDLTAFIYAVDRLHALSRTLGLERRTRRTPSLAEYLAARAAARPEDSAP